MDAGLVLKIDRTVEGSEKIFVKELNKGLYLQQLLLAPFVPIVIAPLGGLVYGMKN